MAKTVISKEKPDLSAPVNMEILGKYVRYKRTSIGMTLEDAASLCSLSKQAYNNVEKGSGNIRVQTLFAVLNSLGIKLNILDKEQESAWY
ncbi:MAG: XRE family transcriptional regulator [Gammaproteobacteria bacterium]|nr:MAG: XRE family transcriptional regulator [Gammaproteobacteria bacterium]